MAHGLFRIVLCGVLLAGAASLRAQQVAWRIPALGAVEFGRDWRGNASETSGSAREAGAASPVGKLPERYLGRRPPAPWLCQGELSTDQRAIEGPVGDLRDLLRSLACDLAARGGVRKQYPALLPFGDIVVSGSWSSPDVDGRQRLTATFSAKPPARQPRLQALCVPRATGSVVMSRRFDAARGLVDDYDGSLDLVVDEGERRFRRLVVTDHWQLVAVRENQDFDFRKRVAAAIANGVAWVRAAIADDESFLADRRGERNYGSGRLALALLTMLRGHAAADDPILQSGFAALRRRRLDDAYSLATALMAMAALRERVSLADGDLRVAQKWLKQLLQCTDPRTEPEQLLRFNYTQGPRYDTSLQQYGLLGLWSASQCGVEFPPHAFAAAARHLLEVQGPPAGSLTLQLTDHDQVRRALGTDAPPDASKQRARVRGFAYQEADEPAFGSMTSAGISGLLLARAGIAAHGKEDRDLGRRIDEAIRDGFAWLGENFCVRLNPGFAERADNHYGYWLYCLERCCELHRVARIQGRDWYYEGGVQLLSSQQANGSFKAGHASTLLLDSTCFAVLFLAKASAQGPITGR